MEQKSFTITKGKGFQICFSNGWIISVQFGSTNYCENRTIKSNIDETEIGRNGSNNAEIAIFQPNGNFFVHPEYDKDVVCGGYVSADRVAEFIYWTSKQ